MEDFAFADCPNLTTFRTYSLNTEYKGIYNGINVLLNSHNVTIYGWENSTAQKLANDHGIMFVAITSPDTPTNRKIVSVVSGVHVYWNEAKGAQGYTLLRSTSENGKYNIVKENISSTHYIDTTVKSGQTYHYKVVAVNGSLESEMSQAQKITYVGTPDITVRALAGSDMKTLSGCRSTGRTMVRLTSQTLKSVAKTAATSIKCTWTTSSRVTGYEVRFMVGSSVYKKVTIGNFKTGVKTFTSLPKGKTYKIQVRSYKNLV